MTLASKNIHLIENVLQSNCPEYGLQSKLTPEAIRDFEASYTYFL
jgi:hypothetical protein